MKFWFLGKYQRAGVANHWKMVNLKKRIFCFFFGNFRDKIQSKTAVDGFQIKKVFFIDFEKCRFLLGKYEAISENRERIKPVIYFFAISETEITVK